MPAYGYAAIAGSAILHMAAGATMERDLPERDSTVLPLVLAVEFFLDDLRGQPGSSKRNRSFNCHVETFSPPHVINLELRFTLNITPLPGLSNGNRHPSLRLTSTQKSGTRQKQAFTLRKRADFELFLHFIRIY